MKSFTWTGRKDSVVVRGSLDADSLEDAIAVLKNRGIDVEELVEEQRSDAETIGQTPISHKTSHRDTSAHAGHDHHQVVEHRFTTPKTSALAVICLVVSLLGVIITWFIPIITQMAAIICGHIARSQIKKSRGNQTGSGMALAGLIISYIVLVIVVIVVVLVGVTLTEFFS